jgi:hypothetical protein
MPTVLLDISNYTPLGAAVEAIQGSVQTGFPRRRRCWSWPGTPWSSPTSRAASSAGSKSQAGLHMSTITILQPELTTEDVSAALRKGLGPRYQVLPGMRTSLLPGAPDPGWPDSFVVGTGAGRVFRVQLEIDHRGGGTRVRVAPGGLSALRLVNTIVIAPRVRRTLRAAFGV